MKPIEAIEIIENYRPGDDWGVMREALILSIDALKCYTPYEEPYYYTIGCPVLFLWNDEWQRGEIINSYRTQDGIINVKLESGETVWCGEARHEEYVKQRA